MRAHFYFMAILPLGVGASIARPRGLPVRLICRGDCNGRHICRPYGVMNFVVAIFRDDVIFPAGL